MSVARNASPAEAQGRQAWKLPITYNLPRAQSTSEQGALLATSFQGKGRQELNRAAAQHCRNVFGVWV